MREETKGYDGVYPQHGPMGKGLGVNPGRVVWVHDRESVDWNPSNEYWWALDNFNEDRILGMVREGITELTGSESPKDGWDKIFRSHNSKRGKPNGYESGEGIAIKVNMNGSGEWSDDYSGDTRMDHMNPVLLKALLTSLVEDAGVAPEDISVFDVARIFPTYMSEYCSGGHLNGIHFIDRNNAQKDLGETIEWSVPFSKTKNYLPTCVTESEYLINFASLKGHCFGVTLLAKNHFGSFINHRPARGPEAANLHGFLLQDKMNAYSPLVDLLANHQLGEKCVLYGYDALICTQTEGTNITRDNCKWEQSPFGGDYTKSVFFSQDPVALDSVGIDLLMAEPNIAGRNYSLNGNPTVENYLHEAGGVGNSPSGSIYRNGNGKLVENLGVHEHWNNSKEKLYSRNLGGSEGIELIYKETV